MSGIKKQVKTPKITAVVMCYNEENFIGPCIEAISPLASEIIVWDGNFFVGNQDPGDPSLLTEASTDGSRAVIDRLANVFPNITKLYMDGLPRLSEAAARNVTLQSAIGDYLLIVDCDEIWTIDAWADMICRLLEDPHTDDFFIRNKLFFWDPWHYVSTKHMRLFKIRSGREFIGANEVSNSQSDRVLDGDDNLEFFFHYGYIDRGKVKEKMKWYDGGIFRGGGSWWYENIFLAFDGENEDELYEKNFGTLHPFGKTHPGYASEEFKIQRYTGPHPREIRQFFDKLGFTVAYE